MQVPPAECQEPAPERPTYQTPTLAPTPTPEIDPLGATRDPRVLAQASREDLLGSLSHWRMRADQAEPQLSAALDYIGRDQVADRHLDDLWDRCASEDRAEASALGAWAERVRADRSEH